MAHLLIIELPGGNDTDIVQAALDGGDTVTFLTANLSSYQVQSEVWAVLGKAARHVELPADKWANVVPLALQWHQAHRIDAVLCLLDIRLVEAARIAASLGLRFLNPDSAQCLRNKFQVRQRLQQSGIAQPDFRLATSNDALKRAVDELGLPVLIKPTDGYGSINVMALSHPDDLHPLWRPLDDMLPSRTDYGLGVMANEQILIERLMVGQVIGCDTFTHAGQHTLLGVNDKVFFDPPSFAIKGGCFKPHDGAASEIQGYVFDVLDAVGFDWGAAHVELMMTVEGPRLIEVNARLVGAKLPRLISLALSRSIHRDLIALHLGRWRPDGQIHADVAATRWLVASGHGQLADITVPETANNPHVRMVDILKRRGDWVRAPLENADRIGYVMTTAATQAEAEQAADDFVARSQVQLTN